MDFGKLLHVAKKNSENNKNESKYYSTKFAPPKKESKEKKLSENIQKFLQKREQEEREREREKQEKLTNLLSLRDEKSKNKIKKMLKVTKSANKSVLEDAADGDNTAGTMTGQDDYGYVSTEANAFYAKYIEKVKDVKEDKGFAPSRPQSLKDLSGTKERVKAALTREIEEKKSLKGQRVSSSTSTTSTSSSSSNKEPSLVRPTSSSSSKTLYNPEAERLEEERKKKEEEQQRKKNRRPLPPPMDFQALLKLAEKKQHEPVEILQVVKKEPERLLTLKEKMELEERQRAKEARERRERERKNERIAGANTKERRENGPTGSSAPPARMEPNGRIPKLNQASKSTASTAIPVTKSAGAALKTASTTNGSSSTNGIRKPSLSAPSTSVLPSISSLHSNRSSAASSQTSSSAKPTHSISSKSVPTSTKATSSGSGSSSKNPYSSSSSKNPYNGASREFPPRDTTSIKPRQFPPADIHKSRPIPPKDMQKPRQFPPPDMQRSRGKEIKKPPPNKRLRIEDDDSEYDSEMDDFIDDGDEEEDYSSHIRAIFGYDKQKYRDVDDDDDAAMESNFAQVQREEYISKKIGIQEDLEDMKLEAMEKQRKMVAAKKRKVN